MAIATLLQERNPLNGFRVKKNKVLHYYLCTFIKWDIPNVLLFMFLNAIYITLGEYIYLITSLTPTSKMYSPLNCTSIRKVKCNYSYYKTNAIFLFLTNQNNRSHLKEVTLIGIPIGLGSTSLNPIDQNTRVVYVQLRVALINHSATHFLVVLWVQVVVPLCLSHHLR